MLKNKKHIVIAIIASIILVISLITTGIIIYKNKQQNATVETLSKYGSRGSEVTQIQTKLKRWGYYSGSIDGSSDSAGDGEDHRYRYCKW